jgi:GAF domain-containing protein/HAMP domain-containing protein
MKKFSWRDLPFLSKITLVVTIMLVVAVLLVSSLGILREWAALRTNLQDEANTILQALTLALSDAYVKQNPDKIQGVMQNFSQDKSITFARAYDTNGQIISDGLSPENNYSSQTDTFEKSLIHASSTMIDFQLNQLRAGKAIIVNEQPVGAVAIGLATADITEKIRILAAQDFFTAFLVAFVGGVIVYSITRSITQPLGDLVKATERIANGDLNQTIPVQSTDELGKLTASFNDMTVQLSETLEGLEKRVSDRTAELAQRTGEVAKRSSELEEANYRFERRAVQLQAIADVARATATLQNLRMLLPRITQLVSERFGFYHVGIFLVDEGSKFAILSAANSEGGMRMLARNHKLEVGKVGIVGYVTGTGNPRIALDTGVDAVFFDNPDLPDTRSEMALPLKAGRRIIGALDVQSNESGAFTDEDVKVLTTLADLVSIAIENARLFDETRRSLNEAETIYRQYIRDEYARLPRDQKLLGFRYAVTGSAPLEALADFAEIKKASETGDIVIADADGNKQASLAIPIKLREEIIGVLNIRTMDNREWSQDEIDLVRAVAERVALSVENARLFEETSNRAERERAVADITNKIRSTNDPQAMVQTALQELQRVLGASRVQIVPFNGGGVPKAEHS